MTEEQLQLLRAARPDGQDDGDPAVAEARAAVARAGDTSLAWLESERAVDLKMKASLGQVEPPPSLEAALLMAMRAVRGTVTPPENLRESVLASVRNHEVQPITAPPQNMVPISRRRWLGWTTAAAAAAAFGGFRVWRRISSIPMVDLTAALAAITAKGVELGLMSPEKSAIAGWLRENRAPRLGKFPVKLDALERKGCQIYGIQGHAVSLECLLLPGMRELHLYCTASAEVAGSPANEAAPDVRSYEGQTLATWSQADLTLWLFSHEAPDLIRELLG